MNLYWSCNKSKKKLNKQNSSVQSCVLADLLINDSIVDLLKKKNEDVWIRPRMAINREKNIARHLKT